MTVEKVLARKRRHARVRKKVAGTQSRPRLVVFRSNKHIYAQVIDDRAGRTLAAASTVDADARGATGNKRDRAKAVGELLGRRALAAGVDSVIFDRSGYRFHGRVRELAEAAREAGLKF